MNINSKYYRYPYLAEYNELVTNECMGQKRIKKKIKKGLARRFLYGLILSMNNPKIISINAKCSDLFSATLDDGRSYEGYVPRFFPGEHWGDYVQLDIDLETGKILNWKKPNKNDLAIFK